MAQLLTQMSSVYIQFTYWVYVFNTLCGNSINGPGEEDNCSSKYQNGGLAISHFTVVLANWPLVARLELTLFRHNPYCFSYKDVFLLK